MIINYTMPAFAVDLIRRAASGEAFNQHTIQPDGAGQFEGRAGEWAFDHWCEQNWLARDYVNDEHADFVVGETDTRYRVDVKAKRRARLVDVSACSCHVEERQQGFDAHMYVFASVCEAEGVVQLLGWTGKLAFWQHCDRVKAGDSDGAFIEHADAGKLEASCLRPMAELANNLMNERWRAGRDG